LEAALPDLREVGSALLYVLKWIANQFAKPATIDGVGLTSSSGQEGRAMNSIAFENVCSETSLDVSDWLAETGDGRETCSLCVYYDRFGFGMSLEQVQQAVAKLDVLLTRGESCEPGGEIQVDRSGPGDGYIMIAFRPASNHASRYFDFPEDVARRLLARFQEMLAKAERDGYYGAQIGRRVRV
jgi:hypothetical protein